MRMESRETCVGMWNEIAVKCNRSVEPREQHEGIITVSFACIHVVDDFFQFITDLTDHAFCVNQNFICIIVQKQTGFFITAIAEGVNDPITVERVIAAKKITKLFLSVL